MIQGAGQAGHELCKAGPEVCKAVLDGDDDSEAQSKQQVAPREASARCSDRGRFMVGRRDERS